MATLQLDLTGTNGLAPRYYGNKAYIATAPQNIYKASDGQMAGGVYNPITQFGYLSPANNTVKDVAVSGTTENFLITSTITIPYRVAAQSTNAIFLSDEATTGTSGQILVMHDTQSVTAFGKYTIPTLTGFHFTVNYVAATDTLTATSSSLAALGIVADTQITYLDASHGGLVLNTTYYVNAISGNSFKLYTGPGSSGLVDLTVDTVGATFTTIISTAYGKSTDFELYEINGVPKIFFVRKNTTSTGSETIGIANVDFSSPDPTWSVTAATTPAKMVSEGRTTFVLADNGFLYALNGNQLLKIDGGPTGGTNGSITQALLFLGKNLDSGVNTITRLINGMDLRGNLWIGLHVNPSFDTFTNSLDAKTIPMKVGVYVWDRQTTSVGNNSFIPITGVKEFKSIHNLGGIPACFTISTEGYAELRIWNGNSFKLVQTLGKNAYPAYGKNSLYEASDYIMWLGNDGYIYAYGIIEVGTQNSLYIIGDMTSHVTNGQTFSKAGIFTPINGTETVTSGTQTNTLAFYLSYQDTSGANFIEKWYPHAVSAVATINQVAHIGNVYSPVKYLPTMSTVHSIDIICLPKGSSGDTTTVATLKIFVNQSTTPSFTKTITRSDISKGYISYELNKQYVTALQVKIEWDTTQTLGDNDFCPAYALIDYDPTRTR